MGLIVGGILAFTFLDSPWQFLALIPLALWEALEVYLFLKWRGVPSVTGREALIGKRGRALTACRPEGQVRIRGEIWLAHCNAGVDAGAEIEVASVDGLKLRIVPVHPT